MLSKDQIDNIAARLAWRLMCAGDDRRGECHRIQFQVTHRDKEIGEVPGGGLNERGLTSWIAENLTDIFEFGSDPPREPK